MGPAIAGLDAFRVFTEWLANRARADARRSALTVTPATMPTHILVWLNANQKVTGPIKPRGEVYELYSSDGRSSGYLLRWEGEPSGETVNVLPTALLYSFTAKLNLDPPAPTSRPVPLHVDILSALRLANGSVDLFNIYDATRKRQGHSLSSCHLCPSLTSMANSTGVPLSQACTMAQLSLAALEDEAQPLPVIDQLSAVIWALAVIDSKSQDGAEAMLREQECKVASAAESLLDHKPAMSLNEASKILKPLVDAAASNPPVASVDAMLKRYGSALARLKLVESKTTRKTSFCEAMEQEEQRLEDMSEQDEEKYAAEFADFAAAVIAKRGKPAAPLRLNALHSPTFFFSEATRTKDLCRLGYRVHAQGFHKCDIKNVIKCGFVESRGDIDKIGEPAKLDEEEMPARADDWKRVVFSWIKHACIYGDRDANSRAMLDFSNKTSHSQLSPTSLAHTCHPVEVIHNAAGNGKRLERTSLAMPWLCNATPQSYGVNFLVKSYRGPALETALLFMSRDIGELLERLRAAELIANLNGLIKRVVERTKAMTNPELLRLNGLSLRSSPVYGGTYEVVPIGTDPNTADIRPLSPLNYKLGPNGPKMVVKIPDVGKDAQEVSTIKISEGGGSKTACSDGVKPEVHKSKANEVKETRADLDAARQRHRALLASNAYNARRLFLRPLAEDKTKKVWDKDSATEGDGEGTKAQEGALREDPSRKPRRPLVVVVGLSKRSERGVSLREARSVESPTSWPPWGSYPTSSSCKTT